MQDPPPAPPAQGPGGPILVIGNAGDEFSRYYAEILRAEGLNAFDVVDVTALDATVLGQHDVAILGHLTSPLSGSDVTLLTNWVNAGGNLVAMRPGPELDGLLGLDATAGTLADQYLASRHLGGAGQGHRGRHDPVPRNGRRLRTATNGATVVATLYSGASTATTSPAVTLKAVGAGHVAAFTFDLARSIVYSRQGNPAWAGQKRDGQAGPIRSDDLFYGNKAGDPQPDWVNLDKVAIPQADELQRLLANLILKMNETRKPLPRFWYFPRGEKAVVVMAVDNHGSECRGLPLPGRGRGQRPRLLGRRTGGACARPRTSTTAASPTTRTARPGRRRASRSALHVNTNCADWTPASLSGASTRRSWPASPRPTRSSSPSGPTGPTASPGATGRLSPRSSSRTASASTRTTTTGRRPGSRNRPGFMTGSGMPMRFADTDGTMIDVYQAATQMTDESGQTYPFTVDTLLDNAIGPKGFYGVFTANMHCGRQGDRTTMPRDRGRLGASPRVPVITARQLLRWTDGRNASKFTNLAWTGGTTLTFGVERRSPRAESGRCCPGRRRPAR